MGKRTVIKHAKRDPMRDSDLIAGAAFCLGLGALVLIMAVAVY